MGKPLSAGGESSLAAVRQARMAEALARCVDTGLGTVWRVREDAWKAKLAPGYASTRVWHPGLSLRQTPPTSLYEMVPLLHGTSGPHGPVVVRGLTREKGPDYPTSFGRLVRPGRFVVADLVAAERMPRGTRLVGMGFDVYAVTGNHDKPRLDETELACLKRWARGRGLLT